MDTVLTCFFLFCETWTLRREAHGLDEIFLAKQQHEKETQELEEEIEAVHRRVRYSCYGLFCFLVRDTGTVQIDVRRVRRARYGSTKQFPASLALSPFGTAATNKMWPPDNAVTVSEETMGRSTLCVGGAL